MPSTSEIAEHLSVAMPAGSEDRVVTGVATLADATGDDLSFVGHERFGSAFVETKAAVVLVGEKLKLPERGDGPVVLKVADTDLALARVLELFAPETPRPAEGVHETAVVDATATLGPGHRVGPNAVVGAGVTLGSRCTLHAGVVVGDHTTLGDDCELFANVVLRERVRVGSRVVIHAGSVIGSDGFGYRWDGQRHAKVPQIGSVIIEDDVEIGSCSCVDRAKLAATVIGAGTKIDNLVQIAHNCAIGAHSVLAGQTGLAGSVTTGPGVVLGGQTAVRDHVTLGAGMMAAACSAIADSVEPKQIVSGIPALPHRQSLREQGAFRRLPDLVTQVRKMQDQINKLTEKLEAMQGEGSARDEAAGS